MTARLELPLIADEIIRNVDAIVHRWYDAWRSSDRPRWGISEAALKDKLPLQLRIMGEQLRELSAAENPDQMWKISDRLDPEARVTQNVPLEELVQEYGLAVETLRRWLEEREVEVSFREYSFLYAAFFELTAESVRRYASHQADLIRHDRAHYLAGVMHQLRTPLSGLSLEISLLEHDPQRLDPSSIARLGRHLDRVTRLVDRILRLERFEPTELPVRPQRLYPARLVEEIMAVEETGAARKGLRFEAHVNRSLRMTVDPDLFLDALGNLVANAVKYTERGFIVVDATEASDDVVFRVRDSGPGMTPERVEGLFKEAQPGRAGGAGIGLQIAQHAAEAMAGSIEVESEPGKGSVFTLRLPRVVAERARD